MKRGPRTPKGRLAVSSNAITHGITAGSRVIARLGESEDGWQAHLQEVFKSLKPTDYVQEELVRSMALDLWRIRRVQRYEQAALEQDAVSVSLWTDIEFLGRSDLQATLAMGNEVLELLGRLDQVAESKRLASEKVAFLRRLLVYTLEAEKDVDAAFYEGEPLLWTVAEVKDRLHRLAERVGTHDEQLVSEAIYEAQQILATVGDRIAALDEPLDFGLGRSVNIEKVFDIVIRHESGFDRSIGRKFNLLTAMQRD